MEDMRALSASARTGREEEGRRIARELHDELGAALTSLKWELESIAHALTGPLDPPRVTDMRQQLTRMTLLIDATADRVKRIATELRPSILDDLGLIAAIEWQAQQFQVRSGIEVHCMFTGDDVVLTSDQSTAVFRIFQEALTNVLRHAQASRVDVSVSNDDAAFVLRISDNGRGLPGGTAAYGRGSLGLLGMRERASLVGATVAVSAGAKRGTEVVVRVPTKIG